MSRRYIVTYVVRKGSSSELECRWINSDELLTAFMQNLLERVKLGTVKKVLIEVIE